MAAPPYGLWLDLAANSASHERHGAWPELPSVLASRNLHDITSQTEVFHQIRTFLADLAALRPTLAVLEDVHWADPVSLELLRHVASHLEQSRLHVIVTYRLDELTRENPFDQQLPALIRESGGLRIDLRPLERDDLATLVRSRYALPDEQERRLVAYLQQHAEGNPFFAVELLRALEQDGREGLWQSDPGWSLATTERLIVPPLVRQVTEVRLARLGREVREALAVAAIIGQRVDVELWASVAGTALADLLEIIETAVTWHVVGVAPDGTQVRFVHALTRAALYESIVPPRRRLIHRVVAEHLARRLGADPDAVAYHFQQAGDARAPGWLIQAGERAQRAYAWLTARERFAAAADALRDVPGEEVTRARLLYRCGRLLRYANAVEGSESLRLSHRLAELAGDRVLAADALYSRGLLRCFADSWETGIDEMADGIAKLEALSPEEGRTSWTAVTWIADALPAIDLPTMSTMDPAAARLIGAGINHRRGGLPWFLAASGRLGEALDMSETFLGHATEIEAGPLVLSATGHALLGRGIVHATMGEPDAARRAFAEAVRIYERLDHHALIGFVRLIELHDVFVRYRTTDVAGRQRAADEAQAALERAGGALPAEILSRRAQLPVLWIEGRWGEARQIVDDYPTHGNYLLRRAATNALAPIAYAQGRVEDAWAHIHALLPEGPMTRPGATVLQDALLLQRLAVDLALDDGDLALARSWLEALDRWLEWSGAILGRAERELAWARYWLLADDVDEASARGPRAGGGPASGTAVGPVGRPPPSRRARAAKAWAEAGRVRSPRRAGARRCLCRAV